MIFATLEEIKGLNEPPITADNLDEMLNIYMEAIGTTFENYCNRKFMADTYTEYFKSSGEYIFLTELPVRQINKLWIDVDSEFEDNDIIQPMDYTLMPNGRVWSLFFPLSTGIEAFNVKVEYEGGFDSVETVNPEFPIPYDLKLAFIRQVQYDIKRRKDIGLTTVTFKDGSIHKQPLVDLLPQVASTLDMYRHMNI